MMELLCMKVAGQGGLGDGGVGRDWLVRLSQASPGGPESGGCGKAAGSARSSAAKSGPPGSSYS